jgi:hypothetical protein
MEMGAGSPGMLRGKELISLGPGLGLCLVVGRLLELFIFMGGGTKTVRTWTGLDVGTNGGLGMGLEGGYGALLCRVVGTMEWGEMEVTGALGLSCLSDMVPAMTGSPMCWDWGGGLG